MLADTIKVEYDVWASAYAIRQKLPKLLASHDVLAFDTETRSIYEKALRDEAKAYLKDSDPTDPYYQQAMLVSNSSGLSYPLISRTTHFVLGLSRSESVLIICADEAAEQYVWDTVSKYPGLLLVHNSLFDLKIMYQRTGRLPKNFKDTALMAKSLINHVNIWKAKTGLKELMSGYYDPAWTLMDDYEPEDLKDPKFLMYAAIDGAATFYLYELILEQYEEYQGDA